MDIAATFDEEPFRHSDDKYKCCCNTIHCRQGCKYLLIFSVIGLFIQAVDLIIKLLGDNSWESVLLYVVSFVLAAAVIFCLFWALRTENEVFILPYIVWMGLNIICSLVFLVASVWSLIDSRSEAAQVINNIMVDGNSTVIAENELEENRTEIQLFSSFLIIIALITIAVAIWFASVAYKYYIYLKTMKKARNPRNVVHHEIDTFKKEIKQ